MRPRRAALALVAALFAAALELALRQPSIASRLPPFDPSHGFATGANPFRIEGDVVSLRPDADRTFNSVQLTRTRAPGSIRIVVLGGSSTYGFPYGDAISHPRFLEHRLRAAMPGVGVEVANLGAMSYGSMRLSRMLGWLLRLHPDLEERAPEDATVQLLLGRVDRLDGKPADARHRFERALAFRPDLYIAGNKLAEVCRILDDKRCAVRAYREILAQVHYSPTALQGLAELGEAQP